MNWEEDYKKAHSAVCIVEMEEGAICTFCIRNIEEGEKGYLISKGFEPEQTVYAVCEKCMDELKVAVLEMM